MPYEHFDVNHVLSTGQSNSVAHEGRPVLSTTQPFSNLMFDVGVMTSGGCEREGCRTYQKPTGFAPLVEGDSFWYPVETMSAGLGNQAAMLAKTKHQKPAHDVLVSLAGRNGLTYWCLRKGGCNFLDPSYLNAFDESMKQVEDGKALATAAGRARIVRIDAAGRAVLGRGARRRRVARGGDGDAAERGEKEQGAKRDHVTRMHVHRACPRSATCSARPGRQRSRRRRCRLRDRRARSARPSPGQGPTAHARTQRRGGRQAPAAR